MASHKRNTKLNIPMCVACVLLCLTLVSIHFTSGLYARYTSADAGVDSGRIAKFDIKHSHYSFSEDLVLALAPGTHVTEIEVYNKSEVTVDYTIMIENVTCNIPLQFQVDEGAVTSGLFTGSYTIPMDSVYKYDLKIIWPVEDALAYMGMVDLLRITVNTVQKD